MRNLLTAITDRLSTRKGMWTTLAIWLAATMLLAVVAPSAKDYETSSIDSIPVDAPSSVAQEKLDEYFANEDGLPGILVFQSDGGSFEPEELSAFFAELQELDGIASVVPFTELPPQAAAGFYAEDRSTVALPIAFEPGLETDEIRDIQEQLTAIAADETNLTYTMTGPAGIAVDTLNLFSRADLVLLFSTVGLILVLLVVIYRSPLLAFIPLLAAAFVYEAVNQTLGWMGQAGLLLNQQTLSIMTILLFAAVIDYSLFVFSRFREELKKTDDKYTAMREAMREVGLPVFYSGGTVLAAMLVLFFAEFGDYRNFAPIFATAMLIIMVASVTLVPALFTLFGRRSFWPKVPQVGDAAVRASSLWSKVGRTVVRKPLVAASVIGVILLASALNLFNLDYEFDTMKSFPADMPSRVGYDILEEQFAKGDLAPTSVIVEAEAPISDDQRTALIQELTAQPLVSAVQPSDATADQQVVQLSLTFAESPYEVATLDALEQLREQAEELLNASEIEGAMYFAGETAVTVDDRAANSRDLIVIVVLESILIFVMLIAMTRSMKLPIYMMGTILVSFLAALGLGIFLSDLLFGIDTVSNRVPLYAFVFLVALGIDYNIMLISRLMEERRKHPVKKAVEISVSATGGVISSAGIILAATFAVLMTQPIQLLFVFGFIVAVGILLDTFLIRGVLMPALLVLFEKEKPSRQEK